MLRQRKMTVKKPKLINTNDDVVNCEHNAIGNMAIAFNGTSEVQMGWLASQADMLAEDWIFAE